MLIFRFLVQVRADMTQRALLELLQVIKSCSDVIVSQSFLGVYRSW